MCKNCKKYLKNLRFLILFLFWLLFFTQTNANPPIYIAFLWHMHQPIYWPYETVIETQNQNRYSFNVIDVFRQRVGPYTTWPIDAVETGINANLPHLGVQVSFTGSLIENLNVLKANGYSEFINWESRWTTGLNYRTIRGNRRIDLVGTGYHHPIFPLLDYWDMRRQIQLHKSAIIATFGPITSKGFFPPETAFSPRIIPALVDEGYEWVIVDNIHLDRACKNYPWSSAGNLYEPNPADQRNPDPGNWIQLTDLWAPTKISARFSHLPHYVAYTDPATGVTKKIIVVPGERYMGNEDARGGFGALQYEKVLTQLEPYNTDSSHPLLVVLHHDGDNHGTLNESYYHQNFTNFVNWLVANSTRFVCTTIQDYLDMFPPDPNDVVHIEDGAWSGADNGDPEFLKWNADPDATGYSADRNSWGVIIAAKNRVQTASDLNPSSSSTQRAWHYFLNGETSCYWYWDSENETWNGHPTRAANLAVPFADYIIGNGSVDSTPPTIYIPQREPYNPGGTEFNIPKSNDFTVWTYVYDVSGCTAVNLKYRLDNDGIISTENFVYSGGTGVSSWVTIAMSSTYITPRTTVTPIYKAWEYRAQITGVSNKLVDYYIEAVDGKGNVARSPIMHVYVGTVTQGATSCFWIPSEPIAGSTIAIFYDPVSGALPDTTNPVYIHIGYNGWTNIISPDPAMVFDSSVGYWRYVFNIPSVATSIEFCFNNGLGLWDNNNGRDWRVPVSGGIFRMDGILDTTAQLITTSTGVSIWADYKNNILYLATEPAGSGFDKFIFVARNPGDLVNQPWAKTGRVAQWEYFLGNENDNGWVGWFNSSGNVVTGVGFACAQSSSGVVEGILELDKLFNPMPSQIYLSAAKYQTQNNGALVGQAPAGNGNQDIEANEYVLYSLTAIENWYLY